MYFSSDPLVCFLFFVVGFEGDVFVRFDEVTAHPREDKLPPPPQASVYRPMVTGHKLSVWEALC